MVALRESLVFEVHKVCVAGGPESRVYVTVIRAW